MIKEELNIPFMRLDRQFANLRHEILEATEAVLEHGKVLQGPEHEILSLPIYPELTDEEVDYICERIKSFNW